MQPKSVGRKSKADTGEQGLRYPETDQQYGEDNQTLVEKAGQAPAKTRELPSHGCLADGGGKLVDVPRLLIAGSVVAGGESSFADFPDSRTCCFSSGGRLE